MPLLRFTPSAESDFEAIASYLADVSGSSNIAERFIDQLAARCQQLASLPGTIGRDRSELRPGLRSVAFRNYVIFFRYVGEAFEVLNVLEGHRDISTGLPDDAP